MSPVTQTSLLDALFDRVLERVRDSDASVSSIHKPGLLAAVRATGWRPLTALRQLRAPRRSTTDVELARAFRSGDVEAFDELFGRYHGKLLAYARRAGAAADAEDLAQEAFTALVRTAALDDHDFNVPAYLFTVVRNQAIKLGVRRTREQAPGSDDSTEPEDPDPSPLGMLITKHDLARVVVLLEDRCSPAEQTVLALFHAGTSTAEIAARLQTSPGNVRVIRYRGLAKLRAAFDEKSR